MKLIIFYLAAIALGVLIFLGVNQYGLNQFGVHELTTSGEASVKLSLLGNVLLALAVIIVVARVMGYLFKKINQPPVMGEVIGGILLGPSFLAQIAPSVALFLIPPEALPFLNIIAQIGIVIYMFLVGLELDLGELKKSAHSTFMISHASILLPFVLGSILALFIFKDLGNAEVGFTNFTLFMGVSMM